MPPGGRRFIVPIVIDADYDGNPARYRQVPEAFSASHWGRAPDGEPDDQLTARSRMRSATRAARRRGDAIVTDAEERQLDRDNPWPGLDSFDEPAREYFNGRDAETEDLLAASSTHR